MKINRFHMGLGIFLFASFLLVADESIPFRVQRVNRQITFFTPGEYAPPATMTVIAAKKGLIVIDTLLSPTLAELAMQQVKKELGRDDVVLVINTHDHFDHTGGNQVFKGVEIVGHESLVSAMKRTADGNPGQLRRLQGRIQQRQGRLQTLGPDTPEALSLAEANRIDRLLMDDLQQRHVSTPPTRTFADSLVLQAGGLELRLYHFGQAHTAGDIVIHIPAFKALFTGDIFHTDSISATALSGPLDIPRWLAVLDEVLKPGKGVSTIVGGHMLVYSRAWLDAQHRYIRDLWAAVADAKKRGKTLAELRAQLPLEPAFAFLAPHFDLKAQKNLDRHQENIQAYWRVGLQPAATEIERVMKQSGPDAARARFHELRSAGERDFFVDEREFNALGYQLLYQQRKAPEAIAVFEMNCDAFPGSWNTWDSLGEALLSQNEMDKAEACYLKSLEQNPGSRSGRTAMSRIRGDKLDRQGETVEKERFVPGQKTRLRGPYLGQTLPGLEPRVFAPGIVSTAGNYEFSIAFTPDGGEAYFTRRRDPGGLNTMMVCRLGKDGWTAPEEASFCKGFPSNEPHIAPDGGKLYFGCERPKPGSGQADYGIWVTERTEEGWGEPRYQGPGMYVSSTRRGDLYMTDITNAAGGGLIKYTLASGALGAPERLPDAINAPMPVAHAFIAPDESYIVFDSYNRPGAQGGEGDLYVSFRKEDGSWGEAVNLGDTINTPGTNFCPMVTPDGRYLFYATCNDIYWVSAEVIQRLRPGAENTADPVREQGQERDPSTLASIEEVDDLAAAYFARDRIDKAIAAFEYAKSRFPAELATTIRRLASFYAMTKQFDKVMDNWELGQSRGLFFRAESKLYEPLFQTERYQKFLAANKKLLEEARKNARAECDVVLPAAYDEAKEYPLFIVLHGNNINTAVIKPKWRLDKLAGSFILAFLQSSQVTASESFIWDDLPTGRRDIAECYAWLQKKYTIDKTRVLIGGFSGGAGMAIDAALRGVVPARGFIALCPGGVLPARTDLAIMKEAAVRKLVGQVIAGEQDDPEEAKAFVALLTEAGLQVGLSVVPGLGHAFPADLPTRLDAAVGQILRE